MNCEEFVDRLQSELDGVPGRDDPGFEGHIRECAACASLHRASRYVFTVLRAAPPVESPPHLGPRLTAIALREIRRRRLRRRLLFAGALAAGVLAVFAGRAYLTPQHRPSEDETANQAPPAAVTPSAVARVEPPTPLRDAVAEAGDAVASLTSRTADRAVGQTKMLLPTVPGFRDFELIPTQAPPRPLREAGENLAAGPELVVSSARRAVDLFLRDVPPVGSQNRPGS